MFKSNRKYSNGFDSVVLLTCPYTKLLRVRDLLLTGTVVTFICVTFNLDFNKSFKCQWVSFINKLWFSFFLCRQEMYKWVTGMPGSSELMVRAQKIEVLH